MAQKNPFIKKANTKHDYTPHQLQELKKCTEDVVYFVKTYCKIQHPVRGEISFELYPYQENMLRTFAGERLTVVLSSRQTGKCLTLNTVVTLLQLSSINIIKKCILYIINRKLYNELFKNL